MQSKNVATSHADVQITYPGTLSTPERDAIQNVIRTIYNVDEQDDEALLNGNGQAR